MGNIKQPGLNKEIFDRRGLKLSRGNHWASWLSEWMWEMKGEEGRWLENEGTRFHKPRDAADNNSNMGCSLHQDQEYEDDFRLNSNLMHQDFCTSWMTLDGSKDHFVPVVIWWRRVDDEVFCGPFIPLRVSRLWTLKITHIENIFWSYLPPLLLLLPLAPIEHFLPDKFPSYFHVFRVCCLGPLHYLGLAAQTQVGHYLLKHGQQPVATMLKKMTLLPPRTINRHQFLKVDWNVMSPFLNHDRILLGPITCKHGQVSSWVWWSCPSSGDSWKAADRISQHFPPPFGFNVLCAPTLPKYSPRCESDNTLTLWELNSHLISEFWLITSLCINHHTLQTEASLTKVKSSSNQWMAEVFRR